MTYLVNSDIIDIVMSRTNFILVLHRRDVEVLLDVVHVVEGGHGGEGAGAGGGRAALRLALHTSCLDQS